MINGAQIMVKCLQQEGIKVVFGYPGAAICPFYDALYDSDIRHILVRQEQNAGHAANGYARMSGRAGVCIATSGPGATNLITAIASAYMDSIPIVAITGQVRSDLIGRDVFQEADITGACEPFTKHSYLVKRTADLPRIFKEAFHIATTGRPGPVLIDVPVDVQLGTVKEFKYPESVDIIGYKPTTSGNMAQIKRACSVISQAKRPVICAGGGVFSARARDELMSFAEKTKIPVVCTMMGIGTVPTDYPGNLGMLGTHGVKAANHAIQHADLIILCGARVGDRAMARPDQIASRSKVIHIDIDPAEIGKNMAATVPIVGDLKNVLTELVKLVDYTCPQEWIEDCISRKTPPKPRDTDLIDPKEFIRLLSKNMAEGSILVADVGQNQIWSANNFFVNKRRAFLTSGGMGTMGYSVPAAVGAKLARPDFQVAAVCGDGAFQMQMMELATIRQHDVDIKIIVMCNNRLGMVRELQDRLYGGRHSGVILDGSPDFIKIAGAYSIPAAMISSMDQAEEAVKTMFNTKGPYLLACKVSPGEPSL